MNGRTRTKSKTRVNGFLKYRVFYKLVTQRARTNVGTRGKKGRFFVSWNSRKPDFAAVCRGAAARCRGGPARPLFERKYIRKLKRISGGFVRNEFCYLAAFSASFWASCSALVSSTSLASLHVPAPCAGGGQYQSLEPLVMPRKPMASV